MQSQDIHGVAEMSNSKSTTILIVDDHPMFRLGVSHFLQPNPTWQVIEAKSQQDATIALREHPVDLAIVDISLPDGSGLELIRHQRTQHIQTRWLVLSVYSEQFHQMRAREAGANGFLSKRAVQAELIQAVTALLNGEDFPTGFQDVVHEDHGELEALTEREMTIFRLISEGNSVEQIATSLSRSRKTINAIRDRIRAKLSVGSSAELSRLATQWYLSQAEGGPPPMKHLMRRNVVSQGDEDAPTAD